MYQGERIRLRRDERSDLPRFVEWLNDPEVHRFLAVSLPMCQDEEQRWFDRMLERPREEQGLAIEIKTPSGWQLIGNCSFMNLDHVSHSAEVGLFIGDKSCWNKGYGTEVMRLLLQVGFDTLNLNRIFLRVDEDNLGGIRSYEKAGFKLEGRLREAVFREGQYHDLLYMSVLRSEYDPHGKG